MTKIKRTSFSDISPFDWVGRWLPKALQPLARLMRLDRPIGTWLLLLPCWWSLALTKPDWKVLKMAGLFAVGAVVMRGAGCIINDIWDRDFDRRVERTQSRPLPSEQVTLREAILLVCLLMALGLLILIQFNLPTILIGLISVPLIIIYPLMKRVMALPQLVLGLAFNCGALMGWSAVRGQLDPAAYLLYLGGIFWTLAYDTIYAHQDKKDDCVIGLKSMALLLGRQSRFWIILFFSVAIGLFAMSGVAADIGKGFYFVLVAVADHAWTQTKNWEMDDPKNCLKCFRSNRDFGLLMLLACLVGLWPV